MVDKNPLYDNNALLLTYIQGLASEEDSLRIEEEEDKNPAFAEKLSKLRDELYSKLMEEDGKNPDEVLSQYSEKFENETGINLDKEPPRGAIINFKVWYSVAATILLLIGFSLYAMYSSHEPDKLYSENLDFNSELEIGNRSEGNDLTEVQKGINYFRENKLDQAIAVLSGFNEVDSTFYYDAQYHLGKTFLAKGEGPKARSAFENVNAGIEKGSAEAKQYEETLVWYQALGYYRVKDYDHAREKLQLVSQGLPNEPKAKQLLDKMDSFWFKLFFD